uniref:Cytochrome P450 n=2 Tax=Leersia perrieri TaxID=77586 RepID=A0A0D9WMT4_9ORYZ
MDTVSTGPAVPFAVAVAVAAMVVVSTWLWTTMARLVWRPYAVAVAFRKQGITGPAYRFYRRRGERDARGGARCHDIVPRVLPHHRAWMLRHGRVLVSWSGATPALVVGDYAMAKQILADRTGTYGKPDPGAVIVALTGKGLVFVNGDDWSRHRRVVNPAFAMDKLRTMTKTMAECARLVIRTWEARAAANNPSGEIEIEVGHQFHELTADVISHTAFGSSYLQGKEVFVAQRELQAIAMATINSVRFPGRQYIPTKTNVRRWELEKKVRGTLMTMIRERQAAVAKEGNGYGNDLLGLMLEANAAAGDGGGARSMTMDEIIDECKTFFFAGHDTTAHLLTWSIFLLGTNPQWQNRLRDEVLRECCGDSLPDADSLSKLKLMTMVIYETLRLYGPVSQLARTVTADTELAGVRIPKGTMTMIPVAILHRDVEVWGEDAGEFNPLRFRDGVNKAAAHAGALLAFSLGHRSCIGQDFAMLEAKATLAMILRGFAFEVSPEYVHAPLDFLTLQPQCGLPVVLKLLD